jgi:predicted CoA-substrate-specific enzyme activase
VSDEVLFCGVDIGASSTKVVLLDLDKELVAKAVRPSGIDYAATAIQCRNQALGELPAASIVHTVSTGYGRDNVSFSDETATEIQAHGVGCYHLFPEKLVIVDIGAQDNKVIHLDQDGKRLDFKMNRKCAAGTGSFLEEIALRLGIDLQKFAILGEASSDVVTLSSFCTVFAKTEILSHLRQGTCPGAIVNGAYHAVVARIVEMDPLEGNVLLTGGVVAHHPRIAEILSKQLNKPVRMPEWAQFTGALGSALIALDSWKTP